MIHSTRNILTELKTYDLILSGHMHNGILPNFLDNLLKGTKGLIAPVDYKLFPVNSRGSIITEEQASIIASPLQIIPGCQNYPVIKTLYKPGLSYVHIKNR